MQRKVINVKLLEFCLLIQEPFPIFQHSLFRPQTTYSTGAPIQHKQP